ncbi:MAG: hypothetical protein AB7O65_12750 [Candidatus Korobacteraceae bacterium]
MTITALGTLPVFNLSGTTTANTGIRIRSDWNLPQAFIGRVDVCVFMLSAMTGTGTNHDSIPASSVIVNNGSIVSGTTSCGIANARQLSSQIIFPNLGQSPKNRTVNGWTEDSLTVRLQGYPAALSPDMYTGVINLIVSATY